MGRQNIGSELFVTCETPRSLVSAISISLSLSAHFALMGKFNFLCFSFPSTQGDANASAAQAAKNFSPEDKVILKPVLSGDRG